MRHSQIITEDDANRREREKPGYLAALRACAGEPTAGRYTVDRESPCYLALSWAKPVPKEDPNLKALAAMEAAGMTPGLAKKQAKRRGCCDPPRSE